MSCRLVARPSFIHTENCLHMANNKRRIQIVLSEFGLWGEELIGPLKTFDHAGYDVDFATPEGKRPVASSMDHDDIDPPLGRSVTSQEVAENVIPDSYLSGRKMLEAIDNGLTRYEW
jgi:hypothetical protein